MFTRVLIGIQARTNNQRLPGKCMKKITPKQTMLDMVLENCQKSAEFINRGNDARCEVALLVPENDPLLSKYSHRVYTVTGPENDVFTRYMNALEHFSAADFLCRITSDCPMVPAPVITRHILTAVKRDADYVTNAYDEYRTSPDGHDVEVLSRKAMTFLAQQNLSELDCEHVTTYLRSQPPDWLICVGMFNHVDLSSIKLSVDTEVDLENVKIEHQEVKSKVDSFVKDTKHAVYFY